MSTAGLLLLLAMLLLLLVVRLPTLSPLLSCPLLS